MGTGLRFAECLLTAGVELRVGRRGWRMGSGLRRGRELF
jgi:hypothetical protein